VNVVLGIVEIVLGTIMVVFVLAVYGFPPALARAVRPRVRFGRPIYFIAGLFGVYMIVFGLRDLIKG
jgi:hypothetical protein